MDGTDVETPISDASVTVEETLTYLPGTDLVATRTRAGETTGYEYDYRHRVAATTVQPRSGVELTSRTQYVNNQVFCREDPYGRKTYYAYRASDGALIREIQGTVPSFQLADFSAVLNQVRVADPHSNGTSIITDYLLDDDGHEIERIDGRGIHHTTAYDSRGRVVESVAASGTAVAAKTVTLYDAVGNVLEVQHPRYFDPNDQAAAGCRTVMTYTGRNLLKTRTEAPGRPEQAVEQFTYTLDSRQDTRTDARGQNWRTLWASCCARQQATIDPLGHGTISNTDYEGRVTHSAVVEDVTSHTSLNDPVDAKTLQEVTTRYDARGRTVARTVWLVPRGAVDPNNVPIAGLDSVSADAGLTTQMVYDENLTDGVGLDSGTGAAVAQLGGGSYNVSIAAVLAKLAQPPANGGAGITFGAGSNGSAAASINPGEELHVTIQDGTGRTVCQAVIQPHDGQNPNALVTWSSVLHDTVVNVANFGDVLETASINALGAVNRSRTDGAGRTIQAVDAENHATNYTYDAAGNRLTVRDPNNVGENCSYDALGHRIQCSDTQELIEGTNRRWEFDLAGNVVKEWDAKNHATTHTYDARNRKTSTTDRLGGITRWAFDAASNLLSLTDAENQTTAYDYDAAGRKVRETYPDHVAAAQVGSLL
jgi:YD repeat-containing protein